MAVLKTIHIVSDSNVLGGKPCIEGRRIGVDLVAYHIVHLGWDLAQMERSFKLTPAEVHAALSYYYANRDEIEAIIQDELTEDDEPSGAQPLIDLLSRYLTTPQAAQRLGITERAVRKLIEAGTLPARKVGANWFIHADDLERDEVRRRRGPGRPPRPTP